MPKPKRPPAQRTAPSREDILAFLETAPDRIGKREIAKAFSVKGQDRIELKRTLKELADEGLIGGSLRRIEPTSKLPPVAVLLTTSRDEHGDLIARPETWNGDGEPPRILVRESRRDGGQPLGVGDRVLAKLSTASRDERHIAYEARPIRKLPRLVTKPLGIFRARPGGVGVIEPIEKKQLREWTVAKADRGDAEDGELVRIEIFRGGRIGQPQARVTERLGHPGDQRSISLIAIHMHGIPDVFPEAVLAEADAAGLATLKGREDLRRLPLITIDPVDARDHDDAVHAAPDDDPANPGGHVVTVAIADVAHSVRPGSSLDREAKKRGNSVYFPDRVVPMLPERISNDLCSLKSGEDRACLAVRMVFDRSGRKRSHAFVRGLMRSAAKLSYQQAQAAIDGNPDDLTGPLLTPILKPLWAAYAALAHARDARGPLDLDLPERKILLDAKGRVSSVVTPPRLDAHRLIEEFMIQANVAAAETLEAKKTPLVYRAHEPPSKEKFAALGEFLATIGIKLPKAGTLRPAQFNLILERVRGTPHSELVSEVILRSQAQAVYAPENPGHFGLNLRRYAHFTSPIRRYADLIVHRALVRALGLGKDGLTDAEIASLEDVAESISQTERRAMLAERETTDRLIAAYLADRVGAVFPARVSGVTRTGLFVRLDDTGADGFVPASSIGYEYFAHDDVRQAMVGAESGSTYQLGDRVEVKLLEAIPSAGALRFEMLSPGKEGRTIRKAAKRGVRPRPLPRPKRRHAR